jgi:hypothetical protein
MCGSMEGEKVRNEKALIDNRAEDNIYKYCEFKAWKHVQCTEVLLFEPW